MKYLLTYILLSFLSLTIVVGVAKAQSVNVVVIVGEAPEFITGPEETTDSSTSNPTNVGDTLTFSANAVDPDNGNYYFAICRTDSITGVVGGQPVCDGGSWCVSDATASGDDSECSYTVQNSDAEENDWYGFLCSDNTGLCSFPFQGSGSSGSPFYVNHAPIITSISNNSEDDPGGSITWTVVGGDPDTVGGSDQFKFFACKTADFANGNCLSGSWCESNFAQTTAACEYEIPDVARDQLNTAFIYVIDTHGFISSSILQGSNNAFSIANTSPAVSNITLNDGEDIVLNSGTTKRVIVTGTISDRNSCQGNELNEVTASLYRSSVGYEDCNETTEEDPNNCYPSIECDLILGESCINESDMTLQYQCEFDVIYHADPTDGSTIYSDEDWKASIYVEDENGALDRKEVSVGVEVLSLVGIQATPLIGYGTLNVGDIVDPVSKQVIVRSYSNVGLDAVLYGTGLIKSPDYQIPVDFQRYAFSMVPYSDATPLSTNLRRIEFDVLKPIDGSTAKSLYWGIRIPDDLPSGDYYGENYLIGIKGDIEGW